jgi:hypothetical protein
MSTGLKLAGVGVALVFAIMFIGTHEAPKTGPSAVATTAAPKGRDLPFEPTHDELVGWCAAYHFISGNRAVAREVERLAANNTKMAVTGYALIEISRKSPADFETAIRSGKHACNMLGFHT